MRETWIVNASPLISLAKVGRLDLLRAAEREVLIPAAVAEERFSPGQRMIPPRSR